MLIHMSGKYRRLKPGRESAFQIWRGCAALLIGATLFINAGLLPIHPGSAFTLPDAHAMTSGCKKASCCTEFCYLDESGVHHCVPRPGDSCECGVSAKDSGVSGLLEMAATLLEPEFGPPALLPSYRTVEPRISVINPEHPLPTPPPRFLPL
jgi:hypothetical protein